MKSVLQLADGVEFVSDSNDGFASLRIFKDFPPIMMDEDFLRNLRDWASDACYRAWKVNFEKERAGK